MENPNIEKSEHEVIGEITENAQMASSAPFLRLKAELQKLVQEAHEDMAGNLSDNPMVYMRLQIRWQQRESVVRWISAYADSAKKEFDELIESMRQELQEAQ